MSTSSILGAERAATYASGRDTAALGPSDSSDSGSDVLGEFNRDESEQDLSDLHTPIRSDRDSTHQSILGADSDASGTGERGTAFREHLREAGDIMPDRVTPSLDGEVDPLADEQISAEASEEWLDEEDEDFDDEALTDEELLSEVQTN
jgi:hypothetical protein